MRAIGFLLLLAGCRQLLGFEEVGPSVAPDDAVDPPPDSAACVSLEASCAGDALRVCSVVGELPLETLCAWGCLDANGSHCGVLSPAGGVLVATDVADAPGLLDAATDPINTVVNTDTGSISNLRAAGPGIVSGIEFSVRGNVGVFRAKSFTFTSATTVVGDNAFVFVADGEIAINGILDLRTNCGSQTLHPPGGSMGGQPSNNGQGPGAGLEGNRGGGGTYGGGGGGSHGDVGGAGGSGPNGGDGGNGGSVYGTPEIPVLVGGSGGGGGRGDPSNAGGRGGAGGGAIQLASNTRVVIGTDGGINAGGCGGERGGVDSAGGGGGSGGTILIEAPVIQIFGGLAVNGGSGSSGGDNGGEGNPGQLATTPAVGGNTNDNEIGDGGNGGAAVTQSGTRGQDATRSGGAGGGVGRIRLATRNGTVSILQAGFTSPALDGIPATATAGIGSVQ